MSAPRPMAVAVATKSVISADEWEADTHVLFGVGREWMLIYVRDHSDIYGRNEPNESYFCATVCMVVWYYIWLWHVT